MDGPQETTAQSNFYFFCMDSGPYLPIGQGGNSELSPPDLNCSHRIEIEIDSKFIIHLDLKI